MSDRSAKPLASVVVSAYKSVKTIGRCMESLFCQQTRLPYEIIVVESSGDGSGDLIRERFPEVRLLESPHRLFLGAAKTSGAELAEGEIILFIDSDCVAEREWVEKMCEALRSGDHAGVGGAILNGNPETPVSVAAYISEFSHFFPAGRPRFMNYLCGASGAYRADVFRRYGGFEHSEPLYVDLMFGRRLVEGGEKLLFRPEISVWHWHRDTVEDHAGHQVGRGRAAAVARRRGALIGGSLAKYPALALAMTPALFLRKAAVFPARFARVFPSQVGALARALPYFWLGMAYWHYGFLKEVLKPEEVRPEREGSAECAKS